jgi:magnesium transporter
MDESLADVQQAIAASTTPAAEFQQLSRSRQRDVFFQLPETVQRSLVEDLDREQLQRFVRRLDPDEVADVLGLVDEGTREDVLRQLDEDRREKAEFLLEFDPETAAGLMHLDYVTVGVERSLEQVAARVQRYEERTGNVPTILVTEGEDLVGELPGQALAMGDRDEVDLRELVHETPAVSFDSPDTDVLDVFRAHPESTVAILEDNQSVNGVICAGGVLRLIDEAASENLYGFAGVREE